MKLTKPDLPIVIENKTIVYNNTFPLYSLDDRKFELLLYSLYKNEVEHGDLQGIFDNIWLMEGVREKGKDCSLYWQGSFTGLIQCKHRSTLSRVGKLEISKEIIKFLLYIIKENQELSNPFDYYFAVSSEFDTSARELLEAFNTKIFEQKDLEKWTRSVIRENKALESMQYNEISERLFRYLKEIKMHHVASTDIVLLLNKPVNNNIISTFFTVRVVVEEARIAKQNEQIQKSLESIEEKLTDREIPLNDIVDQLDNSSIFLAHYTNEFFNVPGSHLERKETSELFTWVASPRPTDKPDEKIILLTGNAGCGKSVILRDLFVLLKNEGIPTLGIKADRFPVSSIKELEEKLYLPGNLTAQLNQLSSQFEKIVVLIDQIDALSQTLSSQRDALNTYQLLINSLKRLDNIRIIISVRTYDLNYDPDLQFYKKQRSIKVSVLSDTEVNSVLEKIGIQPNQISSGLRTLLKTANHLNVFCKIYRPSLTTTSIKTIQDLYQELWKQVLSVPDGLPATASSVKTFIQLIAQDMNERQQISLPTSNYSEQYRKEIEYLGSQGILLTDTETIQFFHQTFYDFVFARSFVESGKSVLSFIKENRNSLFIRSSLKMILGFLSENNHKQYIHVIQEILVSKSYLFHIKLLVYNLLGFVESPSAYEFDLIRKTILSHKNRRNLFIESVFSEKTLEFLICEKTLDQLLTEKKPVWHDRILSFPILKKLRLAQTIKSVIQHFPKNNVNPEELCFNLLARHLPQSRRLVINYLSNSPAFNNRPHFVFRILYFLKQWDLEGAFKLFETYEQQGYKDTFQFYQILQEAVNYNLDWVIGIYKPILLVELQGETSLKQQSHVSYQEEKLFEKLFELDPVKAFWFAWDILDTMISKTKVAHTINPLVVRDYQFMMYDYDKSDTERGTYNELFTQMIEALTEFLKSRRLEFEKAYQKIKASGKMAFYRLLTYALNNQTENLSELKDIAFDFFCEANEKNALTIDEKFEYHIRKTLAKYFPHFSEHQKLAVAEIILSLKDPFELAKHSYGGKPNFFRNYGLTKYKYLKALPDDFLLHEPKTRKVYQELERRWKNSKEVEPFKFRMYTVGPPLERKAYENMDFEQWLNGFRIYNSDDRRSDDHPEKGGLVENYRAFKAEVEKRPDHFLLFVEQLLTEDVHPAYLIAGLDGLKTGKVPVRDFFRLYKSAIKMNYDTSEMMQLIWMADYLIQADVMDEEVLDFLIQLALHNANPEEDKGHPTHEAINTVRGAAVEKLTMIDFNPAWSDKIFAALEQVVEDPRISVRVGLILRLACMMNLDKEKTIEVFTKITETYQPDIYKASIWSAQYLANHDFKKLNRYFTNFLRNPDGSEDIATIAAVAYLNHRPGSDQLIKDLFKTTDTVRAKIIHVGWFNVLDKEKQIRKRSEYLFLMGKRLDSDAITNEYSLAFLKWSHFDFEALYPVIYRYSTSKAGKKHLHYYYEYLLKCVKQHPEKCLQLISNIRWHEHPEPGQRMTYEEPVKIAIGIFNALAKVGKRKQASKALCLFDFLLSDPYYRRNASTVTAELEM